jgi:uncharacterized protein YqeY
MIRDDIKAAKIAAMKAGDKETLGTTRLIQAAIKDRDIERAPAPPRPTTMSLVVDVLQKMVKQRRESIDHVRARQSPGAGRHAEAAEVVVIERLPPHPAGRRRDRRRDQGDQGGEWAPTRASRIWAR